MTKNHQTHQPNVDTNRCNTMTKLLNNAVARLYPTSNTCWHIYSIVRNFPDKPQFNGYLSI